MLTFFIQLCMVLYMGFFCCSLEANTDLSTFNQAWEQFIQTQEFDPNQLGTEAYQENEFSLLEAFSDQQMERHRPYIATTDRYEEWRPYTENKIALLDGTEISASLIKLNTLKINYQNFIAAQAPLEKHVQIFWQMIEEEQIDQIVKLTELFEIRNPSKELAYPYWPLKVDEKMLFENGLEVTLIEEKELLTELKENIQIRIFNLQKEGKNRIVTHYWYRNWMDDAAPDQIQTILTLIQTIENDKNLLKSSSPILVHCSAGIGRTGVFMTLYHLMQRIKSHDETIHLFDLVAYLRWQRPYFIASLDQYKFCHKVYAIFQQFKGQLNSQVFEKEMMLAEK